MSSSRLEVGRVDKPHGVRGELVVSLTTNRTERVAAGSQLWIDETPYEVVSSRPHQDRYIVRFDGVDDRDAAAALRGSRLTAPPLEESDGVLWVHELVGSEVVDAEGDVLGSVVAVEANPASDLLVLDTDALVPLTFLVERRADTVVVDIPPGLLDL